MLSFNDNITLPLYGKIEKYVSDLWSLSTYMHGICFYCILCFTFDISVMTQTSVSLDVIVCAGKYWMYFVVYERCSKKNDDCYVSPNYIYFFISVYPVLKKLTFSLNTFLTVKSPTRTTPKTFFGFKEQIFIPNFQQGTSSLYTFLRNSGCKEQIFMVPRGFLSADFSVNVIVCVGKYFVHCVLCAFYRYRYPLNFFVV